MNGGYAMSSVPLVAMIAIFLVGMESPWPAPRAGYFFLR